MKNLSTELHFRTARSGGKGGQNVNKVETMAEAYWHVSSSALISPEEKDILLYKLQARINKEGYLTVRSSDTRSQLENKAIAAEKLMQLVSKALTVQKARKATRPSRAAVERRLMDKKRTAEIKAQRRA